MKRVFILLAAVYFLSAKANAQTNIVTDTVGYLRSVYANKSQFINKSFSVLLDSLKIPIKAFSTHTLISDKSKESHTRFYFAIPESVDDFGEKHIIISWITPLNANESAIIYNESEEGGIWIPAAKNFYKTGTIREIRVSDDIKNATANPSGN